MPIHPITLQEAAQTVLDARLNEPEALPKIKTELVTFDRLIQEHHLLCKDAHEKAESAKRDLSSHPSLDEVEKNKALQNIHALLQCENNFLTMEGALLTTAKRIKEIVVSQNLLLSVVQEAQKVNAGQEIAPASQITLFDIAHILTLSADLAVQPSSDCKEELPPPKT